MVVWLGFAVYLLVVNLITWHVWGHDKRSAIAGRSRVPEATLLGLCCLGGWPLALAAAQVFRHKTSKSVFIAKVGWIVAAHIVLACVIIVAGLPAAKP